jgi:general secretion pathway protein D
VSAAQSKSRPAKSRPAKSRPAKSRPARRRAAQILRLALGLVGAGLAAPVLAQAPASPQQGAVQMREVDIRAFIEDVSSATGRSFIVDPRVTGKVTVIAQNSMNERDLFDMFMATLRVNGFVAVPTARGAYRIVPEAVAAREPVTSTATPAENRFVTQVFSLKFADAESVANAIKPILSERGQVTATRRGNAVVVIDYGSTMTRLNEVVGRLDQDTSTIKAVALRNSSAAEMARLAQQMAAGVGDDPGARSPLQAVAVGASNSVMLRGDARVVERVAGTLEQLDQQADQRSAVRVVTLRYAVAEELAPVLKELSQSITAATSGENGQPAPNRRANIAVHKATNSLIISADPETQEALVRVVRELDVRQQQILVEAIIVEVSDTAARDLGLQFLLADPRGGRATPFLSTSYGASAPNLLTLTGALLNTGNAGDNNPALRDLQRAAVASLAGARGALVGVGGQRSDGSILGLIVNALQEDRQSNVLSTPSLTTLDNKSASLLVGQQIPVTTGEALSDNFENQFRTVKREDVGVRLDVRPQISEGGAIRLDIKQEVSSVFGPVTTGSSDLITNRRVIETSVQVDPGQVIVLGGLMQEEQQNTDSGVPILRDIPIAGRLFRSDSKERRRTNLMVFLRPTIISTPTQAAEVTRRQASALTGVEGLDPAMAQRLQQALRGQEPPPAE